MPSTPGVIVTAAVYDLSGVAVVGAKIVLTLENTGSVVPSINGTALISTVFTATTNGSGIFSVAVWGNYQISPTGTFYEIKITGPSGGFISSGAYQFNTAGTSDLSTATPMVVFLPSPGFTPIVANPNAAQSIIGQLLNLASGGTSVTPTIGDNSSNIATTAFVQAAVGGGGGGGGGGGKSGIVSASTNTTLTYSVSFPRQTVKATGGAGGITITLPTAVGNSGSSFTIIKVDSGVGDITIVPILGQTVYGTSAGVNLLNQFQSVTVESDNANWQITAIVN